MAQFCYIGIDGGGTKTVGVALDRDGTVLARAQESSINYCSVGQDAAISALVRIVKALCENTGCPAAALAIGSSALDERIRDSHYHAFLAAMEKDAVLGAIPTRIVKSDAYMALLAATQENRGAVLIAGTGVMGLAVCDGKLHTVAGWGEVFGDRGSGYWIGLRALSAALDYVDGLAPEAEALFYAMCEFYNLTNAAELLTLVYAPDFDKSKIAAFAECVAALDERGDKLSGRILYEAAVELMRYCASLGEYLGKKPFTLALYGSVVLKNQTVLKHLSQLLAEHLPQARLTKPQSAAEDAAALYAIRRTQA